MIFPKTPHDVRERLESSPPVDLTWVHGFNPKDPQHRTAFDAWNGREMLRQIARLPTQEATEWHGVLRETLLFWARTAREHPSWSLGLHLELRDHLWRHGYPLGAQEAWQDALRRVEVLLGEHQLASEERVLILRSRPAMLREDSDTARCLELLDLLHAPKQERVVVEAGRDGSVRVRLPQGSRTEQLPRSQVLPVGCPHLRDRRAQFITYTLDAMRAHEQWAAEPQEIEDDFHFHQREHFRTRADLWNCSCSKHD